MKARMYALTLVAAIFILWQSLATVFANDIAEIIGEERPLTPSEFHTILAKLKARSLERSWAIQSVAKPSRSDQSDYDVAFYRVELSVDVPTESIDGAVLIVGQSLVDGLDSLDLDFHDSLTIDSVYMSGVATPYSFSGESLDVELDRVYDTGETFAVTVEYHGSPARILDGDEFATGLLFDWHSGILVITSLSEPYMAHSWWPCKDRPDDKADSMDIIITCDTALYLASNGKLIDTTRNGDGTWTFTYEERYPIAAYLFSLAISKYKVWTNYYHYSPTDSMEIVHHVYPWMYNHSLETYNITPDIITIFAGMFGEYPFINEKYGHASFESPGGLEHQTCSSMSGRWTGYFQSLISHELAHQWWGDMITCETWHDIWLNEGFATYAEALYFDAIDSVPVKQYMEWIDYPDGETIYRFNTSCLDSIFDLAAYDKGAWLLHMLRGVVGDDDFFAILHAYANSSAKYSHANSEFFESVCESVYGQELDYLFDEWLYGTYRPDYVHEHFIEQDPSDGSWLTYIRLRQVQMTNPRVFVMPVDFEMTYASAPAETLTVFNDSRDSIYTLRTDFEPIAVTLDPALWILRYATEESWTYHILPNALDTGQQYEPYEDTVAARGGSGEQVYKTVSHTYVPFGLTLDTLTGVISGLPKVMGEFTFMLEARDRNNPAVRDTLEMTMFFAQGDGIPGDANLDRQLNLLDILFVIDFLYNDGPAPTKPRFADANADCAINLLDTLGVINYVYGDGSFVPQIGCAE